MRIGGALVGAGYDNTIARLLFSSDRLEVALSYASASIA